MNDAISKIDGNTPKCTKCGKAIPSDDINVTENLAYCRSCNIAHRLSAIVHITELMNGVDFHQPPSGIQYSEFGDMLMMRATHRSLGAAVGTLSVALFWNGIVSIFVLVAVAATLSHLNITAPSWFPAPEMDGDPMSAGMTIFLWLFLTPFIVIGMGLIGAFFLNIGGKTEVQIDRNEVSVFTGVGLFGYRRRFLTSEVSDVRIEDRQWRDSDGDRQQRTCIVIETHEGRLIRFGSMLSEERRRFTAALLRKNLVR